MTSPRLTLSDAYRDLGAIVQAMLSRGGTEHDSVTLKLNAKGETQPEVTARSKEDETLEQTAARASKVYEELCEHFRMEAFAARNDGNGGTPFD